MSGRTQSYDHVNLTYNDYTVACICPMGVELAPVEAMLDEVHPNVVFHRASKHLPDTTENAYTLGRIGAYNVVVVAMPRIGNNVAARVTTQLQNDFPCVRFVFLVGIGGGIPGVDGVDDIRLGDIVVGLPSGSTGGVIQFDLGKRITDHEFESQSRLSRPLDVLCGHVERLKSLHLRKGSRVPQMLNDMLDRYPKKASTYARPVPAVDYLFNTSYAHTSGPTCKKCSPTELIQRQDRTSLDPSIHYGVIGSSNAVIKDAEFRDTLRREFKIICVEMEAAGLMDAFAGLVIRGICDYADSHKNKNWQPYAAAVAAAYMKELLLSLPLHDIVRQEVIHGELGLERSSRHEEISDVYDNTFSWILHDDLCPVRKSPEERPQGLETLQQRTRTEFISWLRKGSGIYWVSGKAGSGKSTLMKLIRQDHKTNEHLTYWAGQSTLFIGHFYFHDRGGQMEKTQEGLMRSVLLQILQKHQHLTFEAFGFMWDRMRQLVRAMMVYDEHKIQELMPPTGFSKSELLIAFRSLLKRTVGNIRICLFIDGLDEFQGTDREVIDLMIQVSSILPSQSNWHKLCVSSRPHAAFEAAFAHRPSLKMQDLTYDDIYHYVHSHLKFNNMRSSYGSVFVQRFEAVVKSVVQKAHGVFLWVHLAVMSLLDGLDHSDWIHELEERIKALPPEFESFYDRMVRLIDRRYRPQAARIIQILLQCEEINNPVILSFLENDNKEIYRFTESDFRLSTLNSRCLHMKQRLRSRFGGLIEVHSDESSNWTGVRAQFFHQTVQEYFRRPEPWKILAEGLSEPPDLHTPGSSESYWEILHAQEHLLRRARQFAIME